MARFRKIDTRIWNDQKFNEFSDDGKLVFFLLLTHPHLTSIGAFRASTQGLAAELRWPLDRFLKAFTESLQNQMARYDEKASLIWIPNFLKYNHPESPNVIRSWESALDYLPECSLKEIMLKACSDFCKSLPLSFNEALPKVFRKSMANQEQEQEQEQDQKTKDMSNPSRIKSHFKKEAIEILEFLNEKANRNYRPVHENLQLIMERLQSGASKRECFQIIAKKTRQWKLDSKMSMYLRPETLFNATKFEQYRGELTLSKKEKIHHE